MTAIPTTPSQLAEAQALLDRLIAEHSPGHALQREFQTDPGIYQLELERIWRRGWLFAGHTCQVKRPGDYFVFDVDTDTGHPEGSVARRICASRFPPAR